MIPSNGKRVSGIVSFLELTGINDARITAFRTNVTANFFVAAAFIPLLHRAKDSPSGHSGNIINISSLSGLTRRSQDGQFSYNVSLHFPGFEYVQLFTVGVGFQIFQCPPRSNDGSRVLSSQHYDPCQHHFSRLLCISNVWRYRVSSYG